MRRTITRSLGLGTAALLAATRPAPQRATGSTGTAGQTHLATAPDGADRAAARVTGLRPTRARRCAPPDSGSVPRDAVLDRNGATHVRLDRTYRGLPVVGGDLVVHQGPDGRWQGVSQTLTRPIRLSTTPRLRRQGHQQGAGAVRRHPRDRKLRAAGTPRLVVEALAGTPRLAWQVTSVGKRADQTPEPAVDVRRRPHRHRSCAARSTSSTSTGPATRSTAARSRSR